MVVTHTKEKSCKNSQGNTLVTSSFSIHFCREERPQMLCLFSQGCVERSNGTERRPSMARSSFSTRSLAVPEQYQRQGTQIKLL